MCDKKEIHYKTTFSHGGFVRELASEMGIPVSVCVAVIIYLDEILIVPDV